MKKFFKWLSYLLLGLTFVAVATVLFLVNSTKAIEWAAEKYAPQFGFGYQKISGGLLGGLEVEGLTFRDEMLLERFKIGWNPAPLLHKKLSITHLEAEGLERKTIEKIIDAFSSDESSESNSTFTMPVTIGIGNLHISVSPFAERNVSIEGVDLKGEGLYLDYGNTMDIESLSLRLKSNLLDFYTQVQLDDRKVKISEVVVDHIDTLAIDKLIQTYSDNSVKKEAIPGKREAVETKSQSEIDFMIPESIAIDSVKFRVEPTEFPNFSIDKGKIDIASILVDLKRILDARSNAIQVGKLAVFLDSNLSTIELNASLENEKVTVDAFTMKDIDTLALTKIAASMENNESVDSNTTETVTVENNATEQPPNPLVPKLLMVKRFEATTKSAEFDPVLVKRIEVNASNVKFDIIKLMAESGEVDINASSSFANLLQHGVIKDNHIVSRGHVMPLKTLFETYNVSVRKNALDDISLDIDADSEKAKVDIIIKGAEILQVEEGGFNVKELYLSNRIVYLIPEKKLIVTNEGNVSTPYTENLRLSNLLTFYKGTLSYKGDIIPGPLVGIEGNYTKPLDDLNLSYHGDLHSVEALIDSKGLKGSFVSPDFKKGVFDLSTRSPLVLKEMVQLPEKLQEAKADLNIHLPLDFAKIMPLKAKAEIRSNLANMDAEILYDNEIKILTTTHFPKESLLRGFDKALNLDALNPLKADILLQGEKLDIGVKSSGLNSKVEYGLEEKNLSGDLMLGGAKFLFSGNLEKQISLENSVGSLQTFLKKVQMIYAFESPPLDGDMKLSLQLRKMKDLELVLDSHTLTYKADRKTTYDLNDTMIALGFSDSVLKLNRYHTTFQKQKIFATKPSLISLKEGNIEISPLWINDQLEVTGEYNIAEKKGTILAKADTFDLSHEMIELKSGIDITNKMDGDRTDVRGTITILGAKLHYDMEKKSFASDSDIIIVQDMKKEGENPFMDNLSIYLKVDTKKPILYKTADADIKAKADLQIQKAPKGPIYVLGTAEITKGSFYSFQNKKFVLKKGIVAFTGDPSKPILDISAVYNSLNYEITIQVTGSPATPNIIFTSIPRLSREEILSVILFDNTDAAGSNSGDDMMKMMGGAMAKSALSNVGIKIDHLSLGTDGSMEIGKRISDKVTIIYVNDEVAGAKLQYDYTNHIKAVISTDSKSSGADIIYKREFKKLPFVGE